MADQVVVVYHMSSKDIQQRYTAFGILFIGFSFFLSTLIF